MGWRSVYCKPTLRYRHVVYQNLAEGCRELRTSAIRLHADRDDEGSRRRQQVLFGTASPCRKRLRQESSGHFVNVSATSSSTIVPPLSKPFIRATPFFVFQA